MPPERELLCPIAEAKVERIDEGFLVDGLEPGLIELTLHGGDLIPKSLRGLRIVEGQTNTIRVAMQRGIRPRGRVRHSVSKATIEGAVIEFHDGSTLTSDGLGAFESERLLGKDALRIIHVSHPEYDHQWYRQMPIPDFRDIDLYLGGSEYRLEGLVENRASKPLPPSFRIRLAVNPATWELRRDMIIENSREFRIKNLYAATYRVELSFPGGEFPTQYRLVTIPRDPAPFQVRFVLEDGATFRGAVAPLNSAAVSSSS